MAYAMYHAAAIDAYAYMYTYTHTYTPQRQYSDPSIPAHTYTEWTPPKHAYDERELEILEALFPDAFELDAPDLVCSPSGLQYEWSDEFNDYVPVPASAPAPAVFTLKPSTDAFVPGHLHQLPKEAPVFCGLGWLHLVRLLERFKENECRRNAYDGFKALEEREHEAAPPSTPGPRVLPLWSIHVAEIWGQVIDDRLPPPDLYDTPLFETYLHRPAPVSIPDGTRSASPVAVCMTPTTSETPVAHSSMCPTFEDISSDGRPSESHREMSPRFASESDAVLLHPRPQRWDSAGSSRASSSPGFWSTGATDRASSASSAPSAHSHKMSPGPRIVTLGQSRIA